MRIDRGDEENIHLQKNGKEAVAVCGVCGSILEQDKESGEFRCTECDEEQ
ncbi:hypothetical protein [Geomesophilobacter sediminis]|uniref:Uncharacterized protein n=1 Tax=Geomesophilobacter sediminis TaxID=2798584 RepID=A0A8J7LXZ8_9BACT|nr:hypothetical protein [Geomesophilobacter sediminis]MBJ6723991.1 hypothetical protein [Geomesophilobacter sediminis]